MARLAPGNVAQACIRERFGPIRRWDQQRKEVWTDEIWIAGWVADRIARARGDGSDDPSVLVLPGFLGLGAIIQATDRIRGAL